MEIIEIIKDFDAFPIRWHLLTDEGKQITVRERGQCIVYWGVKSIFSIKEEDVILVFEPKESASDKTLIEALDRMEVSVNPEVLNNIKHNNNQYQGGSINFEQKINPLNNNH